MADVERMADDIFAAIEDYVSKSFVAFVQRINALEKRIAEIPVPKNGKDADEDAIVTRVLAAVPVPKDGLNGRDCDEDSIIAKVLERIPMPKDGNSVSVDEVRPLLAEMVAAIPVPQDGKDADPEFIRAEVAKAVAEIPVLKGDKGDPGESIKGDPGERGDKGEPGIVGKDADPEFVRQEVAKAVAEIRVPVDGKDADEGSIVARVLAAVPTPKDGVDGKDGKDGINGKDADADAIVSRVLEKIPTPEHGKPGRDGKDFDPDVMLKAIRKAVSELPIPADGKDGTSVHPDTVALMVRESVDKAISSIRLPEDGEPGRDALDLDVLDEIEHGRSYGFGTFAKHRGGLVKALKHTEPIERGLEKSGWQVVTDGIADIEIKQDADPRIISLAVTLTSGKRWSESIRCPIVIDRGVFKAGHDYVQGDGVTWDGSFWIAQRSTTDKPGTSDAFRLAVKKGRDGKDK